MSDAQLSPLTEWMVKVVAATKRRPWWQPPMCKSCFRTQDMDETKSQAHADDCEYFAIDAALDSEPKEQA